MGQIHHEYRRIAQKNKFEGKLFKTVKDENIVINVVENVKAKNLRLHCLFLGIKFNSPKE